MTDHNDVGGRSPVFLRYSLGLIYFHFGVLKFFPDLSPAEMLATQTVMSVTSYWLDASTSLWCLAILECCIGLGLVFNVFPRLIFVVFIAHMVGTFMPLFLLPEYTFKIAPFAPNIEGQYIFKNIVFVAAGWTVLFPHAFPRAASHYAAAKAHTASSTPQ